MPASFCEASGARAIDRGGRRQPDQYLLGAARSDAGNQQQAERQRAHDGPGGIGRVNLAGQSRGILPVRRRGGQRQRKARAPQQRGRENGADAARQVQIEIEPGIERRATDRRATRAAHAPA